MIIEITIDGDTKNIDDLNVNELIEIKNTVFSRYSWFSLVDNFNTYLNLENSETPPEIRIRIDETDYIITKNNFNENIMNKDEEGLIILSDSTLGGNISEEPAVPDTPEFPEDPLEEDPFESKDEVEEDESVDDDAIASEEEITDFDDMEDDTPQDW